MSNRLFVPSHKAACTGIREVENKGIQLSTDKAEGQYT